MVALAAALRAGPSARPPAAAGPLAARAKAVAAAGFAAAAVGVMEAAVESAGTAGWAGRVRGAAEGPARVGRLLRGGEGAALEAADWAGVDEAPVAVAAALAAVARLQPMKSNAVNGQQPIR